MLFAIVCGAVFGFIVFFHSLQGFFSATLSAILTLLAAMLALSWHEWVVEKLLGGKAANIAHSMVLVGLFAFIYIIFRSLSDKLIPGQIRLPAIVDRAGGAIMGLVAATFATGTLAIAAEELPVGPTVLGYGKFDTGDQHAQVKGQYRMQEASTFDELNTNDAGSFGERKEMFPFIPAGCDDIVIATAEHLSDIGSLSGSQPLTSIHPDWLKEIFGQRLGIQSGAARVQMNLKSEAPGDEAIDVAGVYSVSRLRYVDGFPDEVRHRRKVELPNVNKIPSLDNLEWYEAGRSPGGKDLMFAIVRVTLGAGAVDHEDFKVRISTGTVRLVARKGAEMADYYPIGTLGSETPRDPATLYIDKLDDFLLAAAGHSRADRTTIDFVFEVEKTGFETGDPPTVPDGTFVEVKRMFRKDLGGMEVKTWSVPIGASSYGVNHLRNPASSGVAQPAAPASAPPPVQHPTTPNHPPDQHTSSAPPPPPPPPAAAAPPKLIEKDNKLPVKVAVDKVSGTIDGPGISASIQEQGFEEMYFDPNQSTTSLGSGSKSATQFYAKGRSCQQLIWDAPPANILSDAPEASIVDADGGETKCSGCWAIIDDGGTSKFYARYRSDPGQTLNSSDLNPLPKSGKITRAGYVFLLPPAGRAAKLKIGGQTIPLDGVQGR